MKSDLSEYEGYYTVEGDTFKDVCKHTGLDKAQWKAYYKWVHTEFMRGETFLQRNPDDTFRYPGGIGFSDPFQKGVRPSPLPPDTKFPLPRGPSWDKIVDEHRVRSNACCGLRIFTLARVTSTVRYSRTVGSPYSRYPSALNRIVSANPIGGFIQITQSILTQDRDSGCHSHNHCEFC